MISRAQSYLLGAALALLTVVSLQRSATQIGFPRDEAIYFEASRRHGDWLNQLVHQPSAALARKSRDEHFRFNAEHPPLMKSLAGASAQLFAKAPRALKHPAHSGQTFASAHEAGRWPILTESAAMRLPAQLSAALGALLLFIAGTQLARRRGEQALKAQSETTSSLGPWLGLSAGLLAAGSFVLLPRVAFHASLHAFDLPIAVATLAVVLAYRKARHSLRWSIVTALLLGLAISIKHNALFVGPLLALHHFLSLALSRRAGRRLRWQQVFAPVLVCSVVIAPLVLWMSWPWLWAQPIDRLTDYVAFHTRHSYYNMEFLGANYNRPPMPIAYPWILTWATVPTALLLLVGAGMLVPLGGAAQSAEAPSPSVKARPWQHFVLDASALRHDRLLFTIFALFPLILISLPSVPIFGGTKHWLTAYPFFSLLATSAWIELWARRFEGPPRVGLLRRWARPRADDPSTLLLIAPLLSLALILGPSTWATLHGHPYNLSQYAPLVGGARGAAQMGFNRGFWGYAVLELMARQSDARGRVYLHDLHSLAQLQYEREGLWPQGWRPAAAKQATGGLVFHERHMLSDEISLWRTDRPEAPIDHVVLDDVVLTSWYAP